MRPPSWPHTPADLQTHTQSKAVNKAWWHLTWHSHKDGFRDVCIQMHAKKKKKKMYGLHKGAPFTLVWTQTTRHIIPVPAARSIHIFKPAFTFVHMRGFLLQLSLLWLGCLWHFIVTLIICFITADSHSESQQCGACVSIQQAGGLDCHFFFL